MPGKRIPAQPAKNQEKLYFLIDDTKSHKNKLYQEKIIYPKTQLSNFKKKIFAQVEIKTIERFCQRFCQIIYDLPDKIIYHLVNLPIYGAAGYWQDTTGIPLGL